MASLQRRATMYRAGSQTRGIHDGPEHAAPGNQFLSAVRTDFTFQEPSFSALITQPNAHPCADRASARSSPGSITRGQPGVEVLEGEFEQHFLFEGVLEAGRER